MLIIKNKKNNLFNSIKKIVLITYNINFKMISLMQLKKVLCFILENN